jgi:hypothetical protein
MTLTTLLHTGTDSWQQWMRRVVVTIWSAAVWSCGATKHGLILQAPPKETRCLLLTIAAATAVTAVAATAAANQFASSLSLVPTAAALPVACQFAAAAAVAKHVLPWRLAVTVSS